MLRRPANWLSSSSTSHRLTCKRTPAARMIDRRPLETNCRYGASANNLLLLLITSHRPTRTVFCSATTMMSTSSSSTTSSRWSSSKSSTRKPAGDTSTPLTPVVQSSSSPDGNHVNHHDATHNHSHSHSIFGLHAHSHAEEGERTHGAEKIMEAMQGAGDRGSQITLIGLFANIILTTAKGAAGWYMHSASLLADAGHSLSDLLGDFVTLFCWKLSRRPPSARYPYGFAKFETLGTTTVSLLLIGGALGIGFHSYHLLLQALTETLTVLPSGPLHDALLNVVSFAPGTSASHHSHAHMHTLDPNAAWFAGVSIVAKEWLYRITKTVADEEKSPVLLANAVHHRSDAYSSVVALVAILGSSWFPAMPLDPLGGFIVSMVILQQGLHIFLGAWRQLTDAGVSDTTRDVLVRALDPLLSSSTSDPVVQNGSNGNKTHPRLLAVRHLRARRAGSLMFVDLTADVDGKLSVSDSLILEERIGATLKSRKREIAEVVSMAEYNLAFSSSYTQDLGSYRLLELPPELCNLIEAAVDEQPGHSRTLTIKGQSNDDAVLCTADKTYALRSVTLSNSVLVLTAPPPESPTSTEQGPPTTTADVVIRGQLNDILELVPSVPKLHRLDGLLKGMEYDDNDGDEEEEEEEEEGDDSRMLVEDSDGPIMTKRRRRMTYEEVRGEIQASDVEFARGLKDKRILNIDGHLRPIVPSHLNTILELLLNYLVSLALPYTSAPVEELASTLADEHEVPRQVSTQVMSWFGEVYEAKWCMDVDSVLKEIGLGILRSCKDEPIPENDFIDNWRLKAGDKFGSSISLALLSGNYLMTRLDSIDSDIPTNLLYYYPASSLPIDPAARFADLFLTRPRWRGEDITPFLTDIAVNSKERDRLLLKYARTTTDAQGVWYTARVQYGGG